MSLLNELCEKIESGLPETQLIAAVLLRAWRDLESDSYKIQRDALYYVFSKDEGFFSFDYCCHVLKINKVQFRDFIFNNPFLSTVLKLPEDRYKKKLCD